MTLDIEDIVFGYKAAKYNGSNGAAICAEFGSTFIYDNGSTLRFLDSDTNQHDVTANQWVSWIAGSPGSFFTVMANVPADPYSQLLKQSQLDASLAGVGLVFGEGSSAVPLSTLGNSGANHDIDLSTTMPSTNFFYVAQLYGPPTIISGHSILSSSIIDNNTVRVRVQSGVASLAGASVVVRAMALTS